MWLRKIKIREKERKRGERQRKRGRQKERTEEIPKEPATNEELLSLKAQFNKHLILIVSLK